VNFRLADNEAVTAREIEYWSRSKQRTSKNGLSKGKRSPVKAYLFVIIYPKVAIAASSEDF
jgi:hypothetical protein